MSIYGDCIFNESLFKSKMSQVNKDLNEKIDGKYPWYFINITELDPHGWKTRTRFILYGFDEEPKHRKNESITGYSNQKIIHHLYENEISGSYWKEDLDSNLKKYATNNKGAAYKGVK